MNLHDGNPYILLVKESLLMTSAMQRSTLSLSVLERMKQETMVIPKIPPARKAALPKYHAGA